MRVQVKALLLVIAFLLGGWLMARGAPYAPEEDAIILSATSSAEILDRLRSAGFTERTANAIKQRKQELRRTGGAMRFRTSPPQTEMVAAATDLEVAKAEVTRLREQLEAAESQVVSARKRIATALARES